jgi:hypothetical protein
MSAAGASESAGLSAVASGFALAATIAVLFNTALACARDAYAPLNDLLNSFTPAIPWIAHGLADLVLFLGLGFVFTKMGAGQKADPNRLIGALMGAVVIAGLGLAIWFALV